MIVYPYIVSGRELAEHLPLEQGLRLTLELSVAPSSCNSQSIFH